jgi:phosphatidylglycerol:prolipoprotein diacylglycerol transferase
VHPTQIYEAALGVGLSLSLGWWFHRRRFEGEVFALYLIAYGLLRSVVELFRGDYPESALSMGMVTPAHWVSLLLVGVGCGVYGYRCRTRRPGLGVETAPKT